MPGIHEVSISATSDKKSIQKPFCMVIFGASGDLTSRKLAPALYSLFRQGRLPEQMSVMGFGRTEMGDEDFRQQIREGLAAHAGDKPSAEDWKRFGSRLFYQVGQYDDPDDYRRLAERLKEIAARAGRDGGAGNCLFYLSTPPSQFVPITRALGRADLARRGQREPWSRVIIEKPFGHDLRSARELNRAIGENFDETQVFRIDHYLGKEVVQNLLVLRFANSIFEPVWNAKYVDHVQITASETLGVGKRGGYYEKVGAMRDMLQNHLMNLLSLVAMEAPLSLGADAIRDEKLKLLKSLQPIPPDCVNFGVIRAQYGEGRLHGERVRAYRQEEDVAPDSDTETFVALKASIDNWRWAGVPFFLRTGKRLARKVSEISIHFKGVPQVLFNAPPLGPMQPNVLSIRIQPHEGIQMRVQVKAPGPTMRIEPLNMDFGFVEAFGGEGPDAYERLLLDAALGDSTLFTRSDEIEAAWEFVDPILQGCDMAKGSRMPTYEPGSWGPKAADEMIARTGNRWFIARMDADENGGTQ